MEDIWKDLKIEPRGPLSNKEIETWLLDHFYFYEDPITGSFNENEIRADLSELIREIQLMIKFAAYHAQRVPELWKS